MADKKISALTLASTPLAGSEVLPIVQSGATVQVSVANLTVGRAISATAVTASTGNIIATAGNFVPSTAAKGINFTANTSAAGMTSQLLNWYEEGTWTPQLSDGTDTVSGTTSCKYKRIGSLVFVEVELYAKNISGFGAGGLQIKNLPFACGSTSAWGNLNGSTVSAGLIQFFASNGNTYASLFLGFTGADVIALTKAAFLNSTSITISGQMLYSA